jgi:UDP-N-acetylglucosamine 4,6-dehydratase
MFLDKSFLVTGGTGSFGKTLIKYLLKTDISRIVVFSRDEEKQHSMRAEFIDSRVCFKLGDIRNQNSLRKALEGINFVFHAAALKQVPTGELFPWEFIQTNTIGTHNLLTNLEHTGVEKVVFLSTDKAVYPVNAMGMTKALMEKLVRSEDYVSKTICVITRYGNVIGSRGSVIPEFIASIKKNESVNITDQNMTRFMMSLSESVDLVMHALDKGANGDLFVQKSPAATIDVIVEALGILLNKSVQRNFVGIRPGEKIHESLLSAEEYAHAIATEQYFQVPKIVSKNYFSSKTTTAYTSNSTTMLNSTELASLLSNIPEISNLI